MLWPFECCSCCANACRHHISDAAARTLSTPELLEIDLLHLPPREVLILQRVSKTWLSTAEGSIKLQRWLFFKSVGYLTEEPCTGVFNSSM